MKRICRTITSLFLTAALLISVASFAGVSAEAATSKTKTQALTWMKNHADNKDSINYDNAAGAQCVDLIYAYYNYLGASVPYGNACAYTSNTLPSGWKRYNYSSGFVPQPGDICVWGSYKGVGGGTGSQYGHVGLVYSGNSTSIKTVEQRGKTSPTTDWCEWYTRQTKYVTCFIRPNFPDEKTYTVAYNANGGSGSMSSTKLAANGSFKIASCGFTKAGYRFAGYNVHRSSDDSWYVSSKGWLTYYDIKKNNYEKRIYKVGENYILDTPWLTGATTTETYTFYPIWLPEKTTTEYYMNYSPHNYIYRSDVDGNCENIYSRNADVYTVSVDQTEQLSGCGSIKFVGATAGKSGSDMGWTTSTNCEYENGFAGDTKDMTLTIWAKGSTNANMHIRWGFESNADARKVAITTEWKKYTIPMNKTRYWGGTMHFYFDQPGTFYINSPVLSDDSYMDFNSTADEIFESREYTPGAQYGELPVPTREGYTFLGWYNSKTNGTKLTSSTVVGDRNVRYYAKWEKVVSDTPIATVQGTNGNTYELYNNGQKWADAKTFCENKGGHLVTIQSAEENQLVYNLFKNSITADTKHKPILIGLYFDTTTRQWAWVNGEPVNYLNWHVTQPNIQNGNT